MIEVKSKLEQIRKFDSGEDVFDSKEPPFAADPPQEQKEEEEKVPVKQATDLLHRKREEEEELEMPEQLMEESGNVSQDVIVAVAGEEQEDISFDSQKSNKASA